MMKFNIKVILPMIMALFLSADVYAVMVTLTPSKTIINPGEEFTVKVELEGLSLVPSLPFPLPDNGVLSFGFNIDDELSEGIIYSGASVNTPTFIDTSGSSTAQVSGHSLPFLLANDDPLLLATLAFSTTTSVELGAHSIAIESDHISNVDEGLRLFLPVLGILPSPAQPLGGSTQVNVVPEPSTLLMSLLGFAGLGIVAVRMRKK